LFLLGKTDEAIEALSKTVELQPDYVEAHYLLGVAFEKQGNAQQALAAFQRSLQLNPNNIDAMSEIAVLLTSAPEMNLKNTEMALQLAETAVRLTGKRDGKSLDALGRVYAELRRYNDAVAAAKLAADSPLAKQDNAFAADLQARLKSYQEKARPASANGAK
jgi:tetratricopeptide (TPR) repeat protein